MGRFFNQRRLVKKTAVEIDELRIVILMALLHANLARDEPGSNQSTNPERGESSTIFQWLGTEVWKMRSPRWERCLRAARYRYREADDDSGVVRSRSIFNQYSSRPSCRSRMVSITRCQNSLSNLWISSGSQARLPHSHLLPHTEMYAVDLSEADTSERMRNQHAHSAGPTTTPNRNNLPHLLRTWSYASRFKHPIQVRGECADYSAFAIKSRLTRALVSVILLIAEMCGSDER